MWAFRRRLIIVIVVLLMIAAVVGMVVLVKKAGERPLCTDNKQNGSETGIDCGGVCARVCTAETVPLFVNWARVVPVTEKVFSLVFQVENRNYDALAHKAAYSCNIMTKDYRAVQKITGVLSVPPAGEYNYVVPSIKFASADVSPVHMDCQFATRHEWLRLPKKTTPVPFDIGDPVLEISQRPRAKVRITNTDNSRTFKDVTVAAVVFDQTDTVVAASTTLVERLGPASGEDLVFTWPLLFKGSSPYRVEFTPLFDFPEYNQ